MPTVRPVDESGASVPRASAPRLISIVLPVYNEECALRQLVEQIEGACLGMPHEFEIIFVNDGSQDGSAELLDELAQTDRGVRVVHLSRNFGHQSALLAGLTGARGDAIVVMDSDLQDDPSAIPRFVEEWEAGAEVVYAVRVNRKENAIKRGLFFGFYRLLGRVASTPIPSDAGNFGLIDRRVANHIVHLPEVSRFYPGLRSWVGYRQRGIEVERGERHDEKARVSFWGLVRLARTAVFSFSSAPLTLFYGVALLSSLVFVGLSAFTLYHKFFTGLATAGWTSGLMTASFFGTLNALGIAVLGEYVVRIFDQVRARPQFIIDRTVNLYPVQEEAGGDSGQQSASARESSPADVASSSDELTSSVR